jgi:hypothetical protein
MSDAARPIFRPDALRRYAQGANRAVLPRFASLRAVFWLWLLLGVLVAAGVFTWFVGAPIYASSPAVVVALTSDEAHPLDPRLAVGSTSRWGRAGSPCSCCWSTGSSGDRG